MNKIKMLLYTFILALLTLPANAHASAFELGSDTPLCTVYIKVIIISILVVVAGLVFQVLNKLTGRLKTGWYFLITASVLFALAHIIELIDILSSLDLGIVLCIDEFFMTVFFLLAILMFRNIFQTIITNKSLSRDSKE